MSHQLFQEHLFRGGHALAPRVDQLASMDPVEVFRFPGNTPARLARRWFIARHNWLFRIGSGVRLAVRSRRAWWWWLGDAQVSIMLPERGFPFVEACQLSKATLVRSARQRADDICSAPAVVADDIVLEGCPRCTCNCSGVISLIGGGGGGGGGSVGVGGEELAAWA